MIDAISSSYVSRLCAPEMHPKLVVRVAFVQFET